MHMQVNWHKSAILAACSLHVGAKMLKLLVEHRIASEGPMVSDLYAYSTSMCMQAPVHFSTYMLIHQCGVPAQYEPAKITCMSQVLSSAAMTCGLLGQEEKVCYLKQQLEVIGCRDPPPVHQMVLKVCACC